jgi:hypothetical protein
MVWGSVIDWITSRPSGTLESWQLVEREALVDVFG